MIDLQNHTIASDGECTAEELVDLAIKMNLKAIAITDHDSIDSVKAAIEYSKGKNIEIITGVELSCDDPLFKHDKIDVLGLFIDIENKKLNDLLDHISKKREENKKQIIKKLNDLGYGISYEDVKKTVKGTFGNPHIAKYLIKKYPDKFSSVSEFFIKLMGKGKPAFLGNYSRASIKDGIKIIKEASGIAILAHPGVYKREESIKLIDYFIGNGGDGIETYYPYHIICRELNIDKKGNEDMINFYKDIAKSKRILESGGNDHHGDRFTLGEVKIPDEVLERLKKRIPIS